jgi:Na+-translocating ferredoxin:NAD+ oxidoreductase RnfG subunit
VLTVICALSGYILAYTNRVTRAPIEECKRREKLDALKKCCRHATTSRIGQCSRRPRPDATGPSTWRAKTAAMRERLCRVLLEGLRRLMKVLVGIKADGTICGIEILTQNETPGLGTRIPIGLSVRVQFPGRAAAGTKWK